MNSRCKTLSAKQAYALKIIHTMAGAKNDFRKDCLLKGIFYLLERKTHSPLGKGM